MDSDTVNRIIELNQIFYQTFASHFSATRQRIQPGVRRLLERLLACNTLLDLGCGNGELAHEMLRQGYQGHYVGLDFSPPLLHDAATGSHHTHFIQANLNDPDWSTHLETIPGQLTRFSAITAFAVLHHLPGRALRLNVLHAIHRLLAPTGIFIHSEWQFLNSPRLAARIQPWESAGLSPEQTDPGDYLLDWRSGGKGLRYVHLFDEAELSHLALESGFQILETWYSDGESGKLGLYQVWESHA